MAYDVCGVKMSKTCNGAKQAPLSGVSMRYSFDGAKKTALWMHEAEANKVLPLNDLQITGNPKDFETFMHTELSAPDDAYVDLESHYVAAMARD